MALRGLNVTVPITEVRLLDFLGLIMAMTENFDEANIMCCLFTGKAGRSLYSPANTKIAFAVRNVMHSEDGLPILDKSGMRFAFRNHEQESASVII